MVIFRTLIRHERDTLLSLSYSYTKMQQDQSWPNAQAAWTAGAEKILSCAIGLSERHMVRANHLQLCFSHLVVCTGQVKKNESTLRISYKVTIYDRRTCKASMDRKTLKVLLTSQRFSVGTARHAACPGDNRVLAIHGTACLRLWFRWQ
jgi:hypothetical protein